MFNFFFITLQASGNELIGRLSGILLAIFVCIIVFLIIRGVLLWYWKVNIIVKNQEEQTKLLKQIFEQSNRRNARIDYYSAISVGNKQKAYESLLYFIFHELTFPGIKEEERRAKYESLNAQYSKKFVELGYEFPKYIF